MTVKISGIWLPPGQDVVLDAELRRRFFSDDVTLIDSVALNGRPSPTIGHEHRLIRGERLSRLKPLDGMRALAVLAVLASHTSERATGGFLGVDVFFVLSGYLITSLLIKEWRATGRIDFAAFYRRRLARLAPAYLLLLAIAIPL
ncbi:MAG TPA: acyltransferase family protein, partial [Kineosporiaceae bacterium]|nr:acyltransferase family protein [Kineosporiaceae bacterium]